MSATDDTDHPTALVACMCKALGLSSSDLAEIGGFTEQHARRFMRGEGRAKPDVIAALNNIRDDVEYLVETFIDTMEDRGGGNITCYRTNAELREDGAMPARGKSAGGFAGPYMVAVYQAVEEFGEGANPIFD